MHKKMKRIANSEVSKLRLIKECTEHEWGNQSQEVLWGDATQYLRHCKHCPLSKLFDKKGRE